MSDESRVVELRLNERVRDIGERFGVAQTQVGRAGILLVVAHIASRVPSFGDPELERSAQRLIRALHESSEFDMFDQWREFAFHAYRWADAESTGEPQIPQGALRDTSMSIEDWLAGADKRIADIVFEGFYRQIRAPIGSLPGVSKLAADFISILSAEASSLVEVTDSPGELIMAARRNNLPLRQVVLWPSQQRDRDWRLLAAFMGVQVVRGWHSDQRDGFAVVESVNEASRVLGEHLAGKRGFWRALENLPHRLAPGSRCAVIVPLRVNPSLEQLSRQRDLVERGLLSAVIQLPKSANAQGKSLRVMWLLRPFPSADPILFINGKNIRGPEENSKYQLSDAAALQLAGGIALKHLGHRNIMAPAALRDEERKIVDNILHREFAEGPRDIEGVCRTVDIGELADNDFDLTPQKYLMLPSNEHVSEFALSLIDPTAILESIASPQRSIQYIIGSNGQGKSWLLFEVARELSRRNVATAGIAFSLADRFASQSASGPDSVFVYAGNSVFEKGVGVNSIAGKATELALQVMTEPRRLACWREATRLLGFTVRLHLVPAKRPRPSSRAYDEWLSAATLLTDNAVSNRDALRLNVSRKQCLAVSANQDIVPFNELSSGEKQLTQLLLRTIAYGAEGRVLLIDEPEASLHVAWQKRLPEVFNYISREMNCSMVVATHSSILITCANGDRDLSYSTRDGRLELIPDEIRRSVEAVLFDAFDIYTPNNREIYEGCARAVAAAVDASDEDAAEAQLEKILARLEGMLGKVIPEAEDGLDTGARGADASLIRASMAVVRELKIDV